MKYLIFFSLLSFCNLSLFCQSLEEARIDIEDFQSNLNENFKNPETSVLLKEDFVEFKSLDFYPVDLNFRVKAILKKTPNEKPFLMPTTTDRLPLYVKYATLHFSIEGHDFVLDLFQNMEPKEGYEDYLFLPFTDLTSGDGTYGGGRYIDLIQSEGDTLMLDFNKSYNPYCAYNPNYSCPIPPSQNDLKVRIEAGIKDFSN